MFFKVRMLTNVVLHGVGNRGTQAKLPYLNRQPISCHMPIPGDQGVQRRMVLVVNFFVSLKLLFFALLWIYVT